MSKVFVILFLSCILSSQILLFLGSKKSRKLKSLKKSSDLLDDARKADETTMASEQSLSCTLTDSDASHCLNQKKSKAKSSNVSVIRKKLWKSIARKEIPKVGVCGLSYQEIMHWLSRITLHCIMFC